jgi:hypothetical protein
MTVPVVLIVVAVLSLGYVTFELLRGLADMLGYFGQVAHAARHNADLDWWLDARYSVIPAEQHAATEVLADLYGIPA